MSTFTASDCDDCLEYTFKDCGSNQTFEAQDVSVEPCYFNIRVNNGKVYSTGNMSPPFEFTFGQTPLYTDSEDISTLVTYTPIHGDTVELWLTLEPQNRSLQNGKRETFSIYGNTGVKCVIIKFLSYDFLT